MKEQMRTVLEEAAQNSTELGKATSQHVEDFENYISTARSGFEASITESERRISEQVQRLDSAISDSSARSSSLEQE